MGIVVFRTAVSSSAAALPADGSGKQSQGKEEFED
jgi:hypothetical protein